MSAPTSMASKPKPLSGRIRMWWSTLVSAICTARCRRTSLRATRATSAAAGRSEEHTSELQSLMRISYAVFCLKKKKQMTACAPGKLPDASNDKVTQILKPYGHIDQRYGKQSSDPT